MKNGYLLLAPNKGILLLKFLIEIQKKKFLFNSNFFLNKVK